MIEIDAPQSNQPPLEALAAAKTYDPAVYELRPYLDAGGLTSYGADIEELWRYAAT
jgi:hypothetical protein